MPRKKKVEEGRRRERSAKGARSHLIGVKCNDQEYAAIRANAAACGMTEASYLALRGQDSVGGTSEMMTLPQMRAWVAELYALKRILRGSANNINQAVKAAHVTGELAHEARHHMDRISRMEERLNALLDAIAPQLKPKP